MNGNFNNEKKKFIKLNGDKQKSIRTKKIAQNRCFGYVSFSNVKSQQQTIDVYWIAYR